MTSNKLRLEELLEIGVYISRGNLEVILDEWEGRRDGQAPVNRSKYSRVVNDVFSEQSGGIVSSSSAIEQEIQERMVKGINELEKSMLTGHPYVEEEMSLYSWKQKGKGVLCLEFLDEVGSYYQTKVFNIDFFRKKIEKMGDDDDLKSALAEEMVERWEGLLSQKKDNWILNKIDEWRKEFIKELYDQINKFLQMKELLGPFTEELGRLWDLSKGLWKDTDFSILKYHAELIEKQPELQELANYLGRMQADREKMIEEMIMSTELRPEFKIDRSLKEEVIGVRESNDINHLLPSEVALLDDEITQTLFFLKFAESKLLTYDFWGYTSVQKEYEVEVLEETAEDDQKGPVIICVDTSGSMHGAPERIAKTLCFAILRVAILQKRKCYLISFSTGIETIELSNFERSLPDLIRFLTFSFYGGTDASPALRESLKMLESEDYEKADVLMISDFVMGNLGDDVLNSIAERQNEGTRFHSLVIANSGNQKVLDVFDNNWIYNVNSPEPFKNILEKLNQLRTKIE